MTKQYGAISFDRPLAVQERDIKLAALNVLHAYCKRKNLTLADDGFWGYVEDFEEETDGLDTPSFEDIIRMPLAEGHRPAIENLGFRVEILYKE